MADKFWCLSCRAQVEGVKEVCEFPLGGRDYHAKDYYDKIMILTTVHCGGCGMALVRSSEMREVGEQAEAD